jgi:hypothetical protein
MLVLAMLKWRLAGFLIKGGTKSQIRKPKPRVVAGFQSCPPRRQDHDQHGAKGRQRVSSDLEHCNLQPNNAVQWRRWISGAHPQSGQVDSLKKRALHDLVIDFALDVTNDERRRWTRSKG